MSKPSATKKNTLDSLKWLGSACFIFSALMIYFYLPQQLTLRMGLTGLCLIAAVWLGFTTVKGKNLQAFTRSASKELQRVTWPTRPETIQTTIMVLGVVVIVSIILWAIDIFLLKAIVLLTGYGTH